MRLFRVGSGAHHYAGPKWGALGYIINNCSRDVRANEDAQGPTRKTQDHQKQNSTDRRLGDLEFGW